MPPADAGSAGPLEAAPDGGASLLAVFARIGDRWGLGAADRAALLGVDAGTAAAWARGDGPAALPLAVRARIGHVVGIDLATQAFYGVGSVNAATHVRRPHTAPDGHGTALDVMRSAPEGVARVRAHVEALAGSALAAGGAAGGAVA